ncbi:hypothetical protein KFE25_001699 [Diacronema lutheri]|uniref:EF-hand domain-containing protein n=1 Tax=Diacronema lutheri TaxID=2081491 RepID=A0A8J5X7J5_DIALT|nr:hypothetical protein KFE25_001699 [Diacronema lutheri]
MLEPHFSLADAGLALASGARARAGSPRRPAPSALAPVGRRAGGLDGSSLTDLAELDAPHQRHLARAVGVERYRRDARPELANLRLDLHTFAPSAQEQSQRAGGRPSTAPARRGERRRAASASGPSTLQKAVREVDLRLAAMTPEALAAAVIRAAERERMAQASTDARARARLRPSSASPMPISEQVLSGELGTARRPTSARQPPLRLTAPLPGGPMRKAIKSTSKARLSLSGDAFTSPNGENAAAARERQLLENARRSKPAQEALALAIASTASTVGQLRVDVGENPLLVDPLAERFHATRFAALGDTSPHRLSMRARSPAGADGEASGAPRVLEAGSANGSALAPKAGHAAASALAAKQHGAHGADAGARARAGRAVGDVARAGDGVDPFADALSAAATAPAEAEPAARTAARSSTASMDASLAARAAAAARRKSVEAVEASEAEAVRRRWERRHFGDAASPSRAAEAAEAVAEAEAEAEAREPAHAGGMALDALDMTQIVKLRSLFAQADTGGSRTLNLVEFVRVFRNLWPRADGERSGGAGAAAVGTPMVMDGAFLGDTPSTPHPAAAPAGDGAGAPAAAADATAASPAGGASAPPLRRLVRGMSVAQRARACFTDERELGLADLFMQIDANSDGTVSWGEFLSFAVLHSQALMNARALVEQRLPTSFLPPVVSLGASARVHPTPITHVLPLPDAHKVLTCSRDGTIALWDGAELRLERSFANASHLPRGHSARSPFIGGSNDPWISTVHHAPERATVFVSTADRNVLLYDASSWDAIRFVPYGRLQLENEATVLALAHAALPAERVPNAALDVPAARRERGADGGAGRADAPGAHKPRTWRTALLVGDAHGDLAAYDLAGACQFARALYPEPPVHVPKLSPIVKLVGVHTDWITAAAWVPSSDARAHGGGGAVVTGSLDRTIALSDLDTGCVRARLDGHAKPILSLVHLPALDALASSGLEYDILLWPASLSASSRPHGMLRGHACPVSRVLAVEGGAQLISLGSDGSIRLWDVGMARCVQVLNDPSRTELADSRGFAEVSTLNVSAASLDARSGGLLTASATPSFWRARRTSRAEQRTHDHAPSVVAYNAVFDVIVSADESSSLAVWKVETGACLGRFDRAHGTSKITSLAFDSSGRRLVSGAHDGSVRVWNFSSGECLRACVSPPTDAVEVTGIVHIAPTRSRPGLFVTVGWSKALACFPDLPVRAKSVNLFPDSREPVETIAPSVRAQLHREDIACIAALPMPTSLQTIIVTASYDSELIVWELDAVSDHDGRPLLRALRSVRPSAHTPADARAREAGDSAAQSVRAPSSDRLRRYAAKRFDMKGTTPRAPGSSVESGGTPPPRSRAPSAAGPIGSARAAHAAALREPLGALLGGATPSAADAARAHTPVRGGAAAAGGAGSAGVPGAHAACAACAGGCAPSPRSGGGPHLSPPRVASSLGTRPGSGRSSLRPPSGGADEAALRVGAGVGGGGGRGGDGGGDGGGVGRGGGVESGRASARASDGGRNGNDERQMPSVQSMVFLTARARLPLLSVGTDGCISVWDVFAGCCTARFPAGHEPHEPLVELATDEGANTIVATADAAGWVKVWAVAHDAWARFDDGGGMRGPFTAAANSGPLIRRAPSADRLGAFGKSSVAPPLVVNVAPLPAVSSELERDACLRMDAWWRVQSGTLVALELIGARSLVLTATANGFVALWSLRGELVGTFGQPSVWKLHDKATWRSLVPNSYDSTAWQASHAARVMRGSRAVDVMTKAAAERRARLHAQPSAEAAAQTRAEMGEATRAVQRYIAESVRPASAAPVERASRLAARPDRAAAPTGATGAAPASPDGADERPASASHAPWAVRQLIPPRTPKPRAVGELWRPKRPPELEAVERTERARIEAAFADRASLWEGRARAAAAATAEASSAAFVSPREPPNSAREPRTPVDTLDAITIPELVPPAIAFGRGGGMTRTTSPLAHAGGSGVGADGAASARSSALEAQAARDAVSVARLEALRAEARAAREHVAVAAATEAAPGARRAVRHPPLHRDSQVFTHYTPVVEISDVQRPAAARRARRLSGSDASARHILSRHNWKQAATQKAAARRRRSIATLGITIGAFRSAPSP